MPTNVFFDNYENLDEQNLYNDLLIEYIQIHGQDMWYIPRVLNNLDPVYGADDQSSFDHAYQIEMFIKSVDGFEGEGTFMSKFGLEIRDQVTFTISKTRFEQDIGESEGFPRPREGDLIFFPLNKKCFEIKYVDNKPFFYPFGELFSYDLYCELFAYSNEEFNTGIPDIDRIQTENSQDIFDHAILDDTGKAILDESGWPVLPETFDPQVIDPIDDSDDLQEEGEALLDFSVADPFSEGRY